MWTGSLNHQQEKTETKQTTMNRVTKTLLAAASVALLSQGARAQLGSYANAGDLILGFTATGGKDYIVDVGQLTLTPGAHTQFANGTGNGLIDASAIAQVQSTVPGMFAGAVSSDFGVAANPLVYTTT